MQGLQQAIPGQIPHLCVFPSLVGVLSTRCLSDSGRWDTDQGIESDIDGFRKALKYIVLYRSLSSGFLSSSKVDVYCVRFLSSYILNLRFLRQFVQTVQY